MVAAGLWLISKKENQHLRVMGMGMFLIGLSPLLLWLIFLAWWVYYAEG